VLFFPQIFSFYGVYSDSAKENNHILTEERALLFVTVLNTMCYTFTNILTYDIEKKTEAISFSIQDNRINIQGDSKLLSGFLWPVIFKLEIK
jgi:hypothetical protein